MAAGGMASLIVGSLLLLSGIPALMAPGAKIISVFLVFATYFGHVVPLKSAANLVPDILAIDIRIAVPRGPCD